MTYTWQLSASPAFDILLLSAFTGKVNQYETDYGTLATLLTGHGINLDESTELYHRVLVIDGTLASLSATYRFTVTRGLITSREEDKAWPDRLVLEQNLRLSTLNTRS